jgi:YegS/Rv2252/BmrU family lipid kinase
MTAAKTTRKYALLINTKSRQGADCFAAAKKQIVESGHELVVAKKVTNPKQLTVLLQEMVAQKPDVLVVGGGDGTVSAAAGHLASSDTALALLPLGTTNNFARTAGLPLELDEAITVALEGQKAKFDIAKIGDKYFVNVASLGLSAKIASAVDDTHKKYFGRLAYALTGIRQLLTHHPVRCSIEAGGKTHEFTTNQLIVANGKYHSGLRISETASAQSGELVVFSLDDGNKLRLLFNLLLFSLRGISKLKSHEVIRAAEITLTTVPKRKVEVDGEPSAVTPATLVCIPDALSLLVPKS